MAVMVGAAVARDQSRRAAMHSRWAYLRHTGRMAISEPLAARDLATFVAAVETGSVQAAAEELTVTQSAATKRIQSLERRLGVTLLERDRHGVCPTEAGRTLYPDAKEALTLLARAEQRVAAAGAARALRLAASHTIGGFLLPGWLSRLRALAPGIHPQVEVVNSPTVLALVREQRVDIGFVEGEDEDDDLDALPVGLDELVVVIGPRHRWARRASLRAAELAAEPLYAREPGSGTRAVAERRLAGAGIVLEPSLQMASTESLKRAVLDGGFALLSGHAVADEVAAGALRALPVRDVDLHRTLRAVRRRRERPVPAAAQMWRFLAGVAAPVSRADARARPADRRSR
jgi:DNA-binding transcriptional LysR family regulator